MLRKLLFVILILLLVFSIVSCKKLADKALEKAVEKVAEVAVENNADIDITKDGIEIKTEEGSISIGSSATEWPKDAPKIVPELNAKLTAVSSMNGTITIAAESTEKEIDKYLEDYKNWKEENSLASAGVMIKEYNKNGYTVVIQWMESENFVTVMITKD